MMKFISGQSSVTTTMAAECRYAELMKMYENSSDIGRPLL
jgi:hypothetical protein